MVDNATVDFFFGREGARRDREGTASESDPKFLTKREVRK